ncbi:MAG: MFS transporter [Nitrososphaerota archaeon]
MSFSKKAYIAILMMGIISLFGDIVYEGVRGIIPDYLKFLGASATIVGIIIGLGELISYFSRIVGGILADKTHSYWPLMLLGYGLIFSLPSLFFCNFFGGWILAALLIIIERFGKGIRAPARDTILSFVSTGVGAGKAFGLHELLDQIGAIIGPLIVAFIFAFTTSYSISFLFLFLPYLLLLISLYLVYKFIKGYEVPYITKKIEIGITKGMTLFYIFAITFNCIGIVPSSLILYRASQLADIGIIDRWFIPLLYAGIQLIDAPSALISGLLYDKIGLLTLVVPFTISFFISPILFIPSNSLWIVVASAILYGIVLGTQESIYRAAIADIVPQNMRGTAYGIMNAALGISILIAGSMYGYLLDIKASLWIIVLITFFIEIFALILILFVISKIKKK